MRSNTSDVWQFGEFRLDVSRKVLWHGNRSVAMPLKELEVLSMLVRNRGELVTKDELLNEIWEDSFVEESNLTRHIYLLRKTLKDLGIDGLIQNVPRRGYRFTGDAQIVEAENVVLEKFTRTRTLIELQGEARPSHARARLLGFGSIALVLVAGAVFFATQYVRSEQTVQRIGSLAVLPFKTLGSEPGTSHMGPGLADILTTRLSNLKNLKVRQAQTAAGTDVDSIATGRKLEVDAVLEGSVYYSGNRVRVTARLVRTSDASIVWTGEFEKLRKDELLLQNDLAAQIVPVLSVSLSPAEHDVLAKKYTDSNDAYELYLRGRYEWNKRSTPGMIEAQRMFRNAIAADPGFALAYVGLADTLSMNQPNADEALAVITKALELDPNLAEAHASRGFYLMFLEWNWQQAENSFKRSIELNPNYATAHHWYSTLLAIKGELETAKVEMRKAVELNPLSYNFLADLGRLHYFSGEYRDAEAYCLKALEIYPEFMFAHEYLYYIYLKTGDHENAISAIARADEINSGLAHDGSHGARRLERYRAVFAKSGMRGHFEQRYPGTPHKPETFYLYAMKYAFAGDREKALEFLEKATDARMFLSAFVKADPIFEQLRTEPRYQQILRKMRLG